MLRVWIGFGIMLGTLFGQTPPGAQNSTPRQEFTVQLVRRFAALQPNSKDSKIPSRSILLNRLALPPARTAPGPRRIRSTARSGCPPRGRL